MQGGHLLPNQGLDACALSLAVERLPVGAAVPIIVMSRHPSISLMPRGRASPFRISGRFVVIQNRSGRVAETYVQVPSG